MADDAGVSARAAAAAAAATASAGKNVRFYRQEMPLPGDLVWVKVLKVDETSASVQLLEYAGQEGMIPYTEFTRLRIRAVGRIMKVGRQEAVQVLRMDAVKGFVDLSKKQVTRVEARRCEDRYHRAKDVHGIVCHAAEVSKELAPLEAMERVAWPLYEREAGKDAFAWFKLAVTKPEEVFTMDLPDKFREELVRTIQHRMRVVPVKLRVDVDVTCYTSEGIEAIRDVLKLAVAEGGKAPDPLPLQVSIVAPPSYLVRTTTEDRELGIRKLYRAVAVMEEAMAKRGGLVKVTQPPRVVGDNGEDLTGAAAAAAAAAQNPTARPDDDEEEEEEEP